MRLGIWKSAVLVSLSLIFVIGFTSSHQVYSEELLTISTTKSIYEEDIPMYVTYEISERIPNEELSIRLYDSKDVNISSTIISDYALSLQLSSFTAFFPTDNKWDVGGVYTIIGEYAGSKKILTVKVITFTPEDSTTQQPTPEPETIITQFQTSQKSQIPDWIKNTMKWYVEGKISEQEMIDALQFLVKEGILKI